jgi:hypothetical protein
LNLFATSLCIDELRELVFQVPDELRVDMSLPLLKCDPMRNRSGNGGGRISEMRRFPANTL